MISQMYVECRHITKPPKQSWYDTTTITTTSQPPHQPTTTQPAITEVFRIKTKSTSKPKDTSKHKMKTVRLSGKLKNPKKEFVKEIGSTTENSIEVNFYTPWLR